MKIRNPKSESRTLLVSERLLTGKLPFNLEPHEPHERKHENELDLRCSSGKIRDGDLE
jgi:hypothetical protein